MKNKIIIISTLLAGLFLVNSCLKDDHDYWKDDVAGKMYATVLEPQLHSMGLQPVPDYVNFEFMVNIATDKVPSQDITLTMAVNPAAITTYNERNDKNYELFPNIEILTPTVVIAKGTRTGIVKARIWGADALDACDNFIAPIGISDASGVPIANNMSTYMMALPIANPYQGEYHASGQFIHPTAGARDIDEDKTLVTVDCKTVKTTVGDLGGYDLILTVNEDNTVTVKGGLSASQLLQVKAGAINTYDPVTKTFTLNYYYVGSGGDRVIEETLVRK